MKSKINIKFKLKSLSIKLSSLSLCMILVVFLFGFGGATHQLKTNFDYESKVDAISDEEIIIDNKISDEKNETIIKNEGFQKFNLTDSKESFSIYFGKGKENIGGDKYDPGASNGISGGAIPTDIKVNKEGEILLADGYGPRIVKFSKSGKYIDEIDLKELRPIELKQYKALCGFQFDLDGYENIYVLDTEKQIIWIYSGKTLISKIDLLDVLKNNFVILDVHPLINVVEVGNIFLKLTIIDSENSESYGYDRIPVKKSKIIGVIINTDGRFITTYDPNFSFIESNDAYYTISSTSEKGFIVSCLKIIGNKLKLIKEITVEDENWNNGDLICISNDKIYYWLGENKIGVIDLIKNSLSEIVLPNLQFHPITITKDGLLIPLNINYDKAKVFIFELP